MANKFNEAYFDAVLTQAFTEFAKREIENEPSLEELKEKYPCPKKEIRRIKNRQKEKQYNRPIAILYLQRVAVCILAVVTLFSAVLITNTKVQAAVSEAVVEWYDKYIIIHISNEENNLGETFKDKTIQDIQLYYVPDGFELVSSNGDEFYKELMYMNADGLLIMVNISVSDSTQNNLDNENVEYSEIDVNGDTAYCVYSEENHFGSIVWGNSGITVNLSGDLDKNELIAVAKNIK